MATNKNTAAIILSTLSEDAQAALEAHFRQQLVNELVGSVQQAKPPRATATPANVSSKPRGRASAQFTNDGTNRSASQWIRDYTTANPEVKAREVVEAAKGVGLNIKQPLVFGVLYNKTKKANEAVKENEKEETDANVADDVDANAVKQTAPKAKPQTPPRGRKAKTAKK